MKEQRAQQPRRWLKRGAVGAVMALLLFLGVVWITTKPERTTLADLTWESEPNMLVFSDIQREGRTGTVLMRLKDGEEQFFAGAWSVTLSDQGNAVLVGEWPEGYTDKVGQQLYFVRHGRSIEELPLKTFVGALESAQENPKSTYLLLDVVRDDVRSYCIQAVDPDIAAKEEDICDRLTLGKEVRGLWDPDEPRRAIFLNDESGTAYAIDPWEGTFETFYKEENASSEQEKRRRAIEAVFVRHDETTAQTTERGDRVHKIGPFVLLWRREGWHLARVPWRSTVGILRDGKHVLVRERGRVSVLQPETKQEVILQEGVDVGKTGVQYRNTYADVSL